MSMPTRTTVRQYIAGPAVQLLVAQVEDDRIPLFEFLNSPQPKDRSAVIDRLHLVAESGLEWLMRNSSAVGSGVYELRHPRDVRIFWSRRGQRIVLLLGGVKKDAGPRGQSAAIASSIHLAQLMRE